MGRPRGQTRGRVVSAAFESLRTRGYAGTSTRAIAAIGGFNPGLIFYYFDSLDDLLVAALEESSRARLERYGEAVEAASSLPELLDVLARIYQEDVASGHIRVVSELVGASVSRSELAPRVVALMEPWVELATHGVESALAHTPLEGVVPAQELALAAVTFYLGANLLTHLVPERVNVDALLATGRATIAAWTSPHDISGS
jgi:AcrR family transcriptional regulator